MIIDEGMMRMGVFFIVLAIMIAWEATCPARQLKTKRPVVHANMRARVTRLVGNFGLIVIAALSTRLLFPIGLSGLALYAEEHQWGLFNVIELPSGLIIVLSLLLLDMLIYWQHRLFHRVPLLWKLHQVHHADPHVDSSTALRFHPLEIIASVLIKGIAVTLLGVPAIAVILFEVLLNGFAIFNHANIRLPAKIEALTRRIIVTQMLHRIHHSQRLAESQCNFGFSLIWWDQLFGSYASEASKSDAEIDIGLTEYPKLQQNSHLGALLCMPFKKK